MARFAQSVILAARRGVILRQYYFASRFYVPACPRHSVARDMVVVENDTASATIYAFAIEYAITGCILLNPPAKQRATA